MEVSNNFSRYDSVITTNQDIPNNRTIQRTNTIKNFLEAFRIDLSQKALSSDEINDPSINFPTFNNEVLQYNKNLDLTLKP